MDIRLIDFDQLTVYEAGALVVTWLAYPDGSEDLMGRVHAALVPARSERRARMIRTGPTRHKD
jgi:hypothetical protein